MRRIASRLSIAFGIALFGVVAGAVSIPLTLPSPTGMHPVGTIATTLAGAVRVQLWYPAQGTLGAARAPYRPDVPVPERSIRERLLFPLVRPAAFLAVPVAAGRHSLVLYVPGWGGQRSENTALCEDLASHGFVVVAMDDQQPLPGMDFSSSKAAANTLRLANLKVRLQSRDLSKILTALEEMPQKDPIYRVTRAMDFRRVGAVGFSFGGATAAEAALHDSRNARAVNLDGWIFGNVEQHGLAKPFLIISTGADAFDSPSASIVQTHSRSTFEMTFDRQNMQQTLVGFQRHGGYLVTVDGTRHESFTDAGFLAWRLRGHGSIDGRRASRIVAAYAGEFLGSVLDGRPAPSFDRGSAGLAGQASRSLLDRAAEITTWTKRSIRPTTTG
jgi:dienelactone hydrolase